LPLSLSGVVCTCEDIRSERRGFLRSCPSPVEFFTGANCQQKDVTLEDGWLLLTLPRFKEPISDVCGTIMTKSGSTALTARERVENGGKRGRVGLWALSNVAHTTAQASRRVWRKFLLSVKLRSMMMQRDCGAVPLEIHYGGIGDAR